MAKNTKTWMGYRKSAVGTCKGNERKTEMKKQKMGKGVKFERIRRITGYLVGTLDKWNDAKKAEEKDRVKHSGVKKDG